MSSTNNILAFERYTDRARRVMALANQEAGRLNHEYIATEHILLGLVKESSGVGANALKNLEVDLHKVRLEVERIVKSGSEMVAMEKRPLAPRAKKAIEYAIEEARALNHKYVGTEHLLLGLLREQDGVAAQVLWNLGLKEVDRVREEVLNLLGVAVETQAVVTKDDLSLDAGIVDELLPEQTPIEEMRERRLRLELPSGGTMTITAGQVPYYQLVIPNSDIALAGHISPEIAACLYEAQDAAGRTNVGKLYELLKPLLPPST